MRLVLVHDSTFRPLSPSERQALAGELVAQIQAATDGDRLTLLVGDMGSLSGGVTEMLRSHASVPAEGRAFKQLWSRETKLSDVALALEAESIRLNSEQHPIGPARTALVVVSPAHLFVRLAKHYGERVGSNKASWPAMIVIETDAAPPAAS